MHFLKYVNLDLFNIKLDSIRPRLILLKYYFFVISFNGVIFFLYFFFEKNMFFQLLIRNLKCVSLCIFKNCIPINENLMNFINYFS